MSLFFSTFFVGDFQYVSTLPKTDYSPASAFSVLALLNGTTGASQLKFCLLCYIFLEKNTC